jgi:formate hydrogenlyase subunit 3/multisubunit Na+/H+ antiporter MnhD subunit
MLSTLLRTFLHFIRWWPEIPVLLAIFSPTVSMGDVCLSVYKKEKASSRYTGGKTKLSKMVFKQALFFVGAFYITWVPYLTLQVS